MWIPLVVNVLLAVAGHFLSLSLIPKLSNMFVRANLFGVDLNKKDKRQM